MKRWKPRKTILMNKSGNIPKIIHQIWIGSRQVHVDIQNDGWVPLESLAKANFWITWKYIVPLLNAIYAMMTDLMRLKILSRWYIQCLKQKRKTGFESTNISIISIFLVKPIQMQL